MSKEMLAAAIGGAGDILNTLGSVYNTERTIKGQKELAEYAYTKDLEMWNRANEYNSPTAQMGRLKQAGLNPNLVYGNGSVSGNTSTQTPKYQMYNPEYKYQAPRFVGALQTLGMYQDYQYRKEMARGVGLENEYKAARNLFALDQFRENLDFTFAKRINETARNTGLVTQRRLEVEKLQKQVDNILPAQLSLYNTQIQNLRENTVSKELENRLLKMGLSKSDALWQRLLFLNAGDYMDRMKNSFKRDVFGQ